MQAVTANLAAVREARRRESENTGYS